MSKIEFDKNMSPYTWIFVGLMVALVIIGLLFS